MQAALVMMQIGRGPHGHEHGEARHDQAQALQQVCRSGFHARILPPARQTASGTNKTAGGVNRRPWLREQRRLVALLVLHLDLTLGLVLALIGMVIFLVITAMDTVVSVVMRRECKAG